MGFAWFAAHLWDSRRSLSLPGQPGAGVFSRNGVAAWDSITNFQKTAAEDVERTEKLPTPLFASLLVFRGNPKAFARFHPSMGWLCKFSAISSTPHDRSGSPRSINGSPA